MLCGRFIFVHSNVARERSTPTLARFVVKESRRWRRDMAQGRTRPADAEVRPGRDPRSPQRIPAPIPSAISPPTDTRPLLDFSLLMQKRLFAYRRPPPSDPPPTQAAQGAPRHALKARDAAVVAAARARSPRGAQPPRRGTRDRVRASNLRHGGQGDESDRRRIFRRGRLGGSRRGGRGPRASEPRRRLNMSAAMGANGTEMGASALGSVRTSSAASLSNASQLANSSRAGGSSRASSSRTSGRGSRAESDGDDTPRHALNPGGVPADEIQSEFRERLWGYLLNNMVGARGRGCTSYASSRAASRRWPPRSRSWRSPWTTSETSRRGSGTRSSSPAAGSISWDVGRTDARPDPRHAEMISALTGYPTPPTSAKGRKPTDGSVGRVKIAISDVEDADARSDTDARHARTTSGEGKGDGEWQTAGRGARRWLTRRRPPAPRRREPRHNSNKNRNRRERGRSPPRR